MTRPRLSRPLGPALLCGLLISCVVPELADEERGMPDPSVDHIVIVWLKEPGSGEARRQVAAATRSFRDLPGLLEVAVGTPLASERPAVDDSFDLGIRMRFRDREALDHYLAHPRHQTAVNEVLAPLVARFLVYDVLIFSPELIVGE